MKNVLYACQGRCLFGYLPRSPTLQVDSLLAEPPGKPIQYSIMTYMGIKSKKEQMYVYV